MFRRKIILIALAALLIAAAGLTAFFIKPKRPDVSAGVPRNHFVRSAPSADRQSPNAPLPSVTQPVQSPATANPQPPAGTLSPNNMPNPAGVQPPANGQPPSQSAQPDTNRTVASIMEKLKLTAEQKTRIEALRAEATTRMSAIQHDPKLSEEGKHLRTRKLWWEYTVKFRQVLTPEQQRLAMQELTNSGIHLPSETPAAPPKSDLHVSADQDRKLSQLQDDLQAKITKTRLS